MRVAIISDIHEDIISLRQAIQKIHRRGVDEIICLGDISGFSVPHSKYFDSRDAKACLDLLRESCSTIIVGNHDLEAAKKLPGINPDFTYPQNWYELDYYERKTLADGRVWIYDKQELDPLYAKSDIEFLKTLPEIYIKDIGEQRVMFSHYVYPNLTGCLAKFYHTVADYHQHFGFMREHDCSLSFTGHAHSGGLFIANEHREVHKRFRRKYYPKEMTSIVVPTISSSVFANGFCIFDSSKGWIKAIGI